MLKKLNLSKILKNYVIHIGLGVLLALLILYISSSEFRKNLVDLNIDPNFIIGFFTVIAVFLSLIQASRDKKYAYNLALVHSMEEHGLKIISKLIGIKSKSEEYRVNIEGHKHAIDKGMLYKDAGDNLSRESVMRDMDLVVAYIDTYFPDQGERWGELQEKLTDIANISINISANYEGNLDLIEKGVPIDVKALNEIDSSLQDANKINKDIENLTFEIRQAVVEKINVTKNDLKKTFYFSL